MFPTPLVHRKINPTVVVFTFVMKCLLTQTFVNTSADTSVSVPI